MPLQLEIISEHHDLVGEEATREFGENGGTIGRSLQNDWILPDPLKYISSRHAVIDQKGGIYYLVDISTNGTFINDEREAIGKGNPRRLFNGDRVRMGEFEIRVAIDQGESIAMPIEGERTEYPEPIEQSVPEYDFGSSMQLLDESELQSDDAFAAAFDSEPKDPVVVIDNSRVTASEDDFSNSESANNADTDPDDYSDIFTDLSGDRQEALAKPAAASSATTSDTELLDCFLEGAGLGRQNLDADADAAAVMKNAGAMLKEFIEGSSRLLASRANLKASFRLDQTTILPRQNNPLKLAESATDSMQQLLLGGGGEYLGPREAVQEACRDLLYHQDAFLEAMGSAFEEFSDRLDPAELTASFDRHLGSKPWLGFLNRLKYWQLYSDVYPVITDKEDGRFPQVVVEEFVTAYERRIAEFKRLEAADGYEPPTEVDGMQVDVEITVTEKLRRPTDDDLAAAADDQDLDIEGLEDIIVAGRAAKEA